MAVPEQVRKQTEAVQALYDDLNTVNGSPENGETPVKEAHLQEVLAANSVQEHAPKSQADEQASGNQDGDWRQKYQTLQGMYNADVPRLNAQLQDLARRNEQMEHVIATMQAAPAATSEAAPAPVSSLTAEEVDEYGESIDVMRKVSREVAGQYEQQIADMQKVIRELQRSVVPRVEHIASQQAHSAEQAFWSGLQSAVPEWRTINENQDFQSWLLETDPLSGLTRQTYLDDAQRNLDVRRVASFFSSWQSATGASHAQPNRSAANSELEKQIAPGRGRSSGTPQSGELKTYTPNDISKFFADVRLGKFKGKEDTRDAIERDIFAAQADGRIVPA
jgi:hypothetical protein